MRLFPTRTIREVTDTLIDYRGKTPTKTLNGVKLITAKVIKDGFVADGNHEYIAEADYDAWMRRGLPKQWDILITTEAPLGEVAQLRTPERIALAQRVILLRGNPTVIDQSYFYHALKSPLVQAGLKMRSSGTTVLGIKQSELWHVEIPYPALSTQRRIASILSAYDDLIENNTRRIKILEEMAQMIYREWFVNFRFPGHENVKLVESELGPIPEGWTVQPLGNLTSVVTKGTTPTTLGRQFQESGVNFVKVESITESGGFIDNKLAKIDTQTHELLKRSQLRKDDILFSIAGAIGRVAVVPLRLLPANTNQALAILRCADPNFLTYLLSTVRSAHFQNFSLGRVVQTAQANVSLSILKSAPILVPSPALLTAFQHAVEPILRLIDVNSAKNNNLRTTRDLLLPKLISGEIPVDAADEQAAELMEQTA